MHLRIRPLTPFVTLVLAISAHAQIYSQQGNKLVGSGFINNGNPTTGSGVGVNQGSSVALSGDGNTALVGGPNDNSGVGAVWVYVRNGTVWTQQGSKLVASDASGNANFGQSVALSADGNTALIGGPADNNNSGAVWTFTRSSSGNWTQQGSKLVGSFASHTTGQGYSVALSPDGKTALVGGQTQSQLVALAFTRSSNGSWTQEGNEMVAAGSIDTSGLYGFTFNFAVALSGDANTAAIGGLIETSAGAGTVNAAWLFTRNTSGQWTDQAFHLTGNALVQPTVPSVALSSDGNTLIESGPLVFVRDANGNWTQQGSLTITEGAQTVNGSPVALSGDGNTAVVGTPADNGGNGAGWVFTRYSSGNWTQSGNKLVATGGIYTFGPGGLGVGSSVALSTDASTALLGGPYDNNLVGAAWPFVRSSPVFSWIPGSLTQVAVGADGSVWGINQSQQIYTWNFSSSSWTNIPGSLTQIAVGSSNAVWGINAQQHIYRWDSAHSKWVQVPGSLTQIAVGADGDVWGLDGQSAILHYNAETGSFVQVQGSLTQIAVGSAGAVYGLEQSGGIYWYNIGTQDFRLIANSSGFSQISVGSDGDLWAVKDAVAYHYDVLHNTMDATPGSITQVEVGFGAAVFGLNAGGQIYEWSAGAATWVEIPGNLASIAVGANGSMWGVNSSQQIYQFEGPTRPQHGLLYQSATSLSQVSVGADGSVWGLAISSIENYYGPHTVEYFNSGTQSFEAVTGAPQLTQISVGAGADVWGLDSSNNIYQYDATAGTWNNIPGTLISVQVATDGSVWGINSSNSIFTYNFSTNSWTLLPGQLSLLAVGKDGSVWGLNQNQQIYRFDRTTQTWVNIPGSLTNIWVGSAGSAWGENEHSQTYRFDSTTQSWVYVPNVPGGIVSPYRLTARLGPSMRSRTSGNGMRQPEPFTKSGAWPVFTLVFPTLSTSAFLPEMQLTFGRAP